MIYSKNAEKRCGLCRFATIENDETCYCQKTKKSVPLTHLICKHFSYDILKKTVRRKRRINTDFSSEDFSL